MKDISELYYRLGRLLVLHGVEKKIILYPFGEIGKHVKGLLNNWGIKEALIIDNQLCKTNPMIYPIEILETLDTSQYVLVITSDNRNIHEEIRERVKEYLPSECIFDIFPNKPYLLEDARIKSLEIASREIEAKAVAGAVAEAGVYQGGYAYYMNQFFKDRNLYLFDTFCGFAEEDLQYDSEKGFSKSWDALFIDTSEESVLAKMEYPEKCIIRKGYFPETAKGIEEEFCFVHLDMDLYKPIKAGLEFFWPRLSRGGYIFVHDCNLNHLNFGGARQAVLEFCEENQIGYVMLPDGYTAVLTK